MLGKLVKEEFKSYRFSFGIVFLAGIIFTVFIKAICLIPYEQNTKAVLQMFMIFVYIFILMAMSIAAQVLIVLRFYSTMVGDRGYLTWTLPATSATHLWAKLIGGILWKLLLTVVVAVMVVIFFAGDYWTWFEEFPEMYNGGDSISLGWLIQQMIQDIWDEIELFEIIQIGMEMISAFIWSVAALLLVYLCIAIGQLFGKWRILVSIGCYFLIVIVLQVFSVVGIAILSQINMLRDVQSPPETLIWDFVSIFLGVAASAGQFVLTNYIFKKHLNLE